MFRLMPTPKLAPMLKSIPAKKGTGPMVKVWVKPASKANVAPPFPRSSRDWSLRRYSPCMAAKGVT